MYRQFTAARRRTRFRLNTGRRWTPHSLLKAFYYFDTIFYWCVGLEIMEIFLLLNTRLQLRAAPFAAAWPSQPCCAGLQAQAQAHVVPGGEKNSPGSVQGFIFIFRAIGAQLYSFNLTTAAKTFLLPSRLALSYKVACIFCIFNKPSCLHSVSVCLKPSVLPCPVCSHILHLL